MRCIAATLLLLSGSVATGLAGEVQFKTRAIWVDPPSFSTAAAADEMLARCQRAGLNLILPNVMSYRTVSFKSPHFKGRVTANGTFDPLAYVLEKAHALGIKVQPWCCVYYEGSGRGSNRLAHESWLNRSLDGKPFEQRFLSPSIPEVNPYLCSVIKDLLSYDIDGIHLDYIRYPGSGFDYSEAGRKAFEADGGFDPQDFVDHPERIVPPEQEPFQIRVLHPATFADKVWEITAIERTLDQAGIGFAYVSDAPELIKRLRAPGLLIISSYDDVPSAMEEALEAYVARGGNVLWTDGPARALSKSKSLQAFTGLAGARWTGERRMALRAACGQPLAGVLSTNFFSTESFSEPVPAEAAIIASLNTGEAAITLRKAGKGRVLVAGFQLMKSPSPVAAHIAAEIVGWLRAETGVKVDDPLAAKRAEWVKWRGERVTQLVRAISAAARQANSNLVISSSGGPSAFEYYGCYRDARRWLSEGINGQLFPMNYTPDPVALSDMLEWQAESAPPGEFGDIFPGLQIYTSRNVSGQRVTHPIDAAIVEQELGIVRQKGYQGFCLFAYDYLSDEIMEVARRAVR